MRLRALVLAIIPIVGAAGRAAFADEARPRLTLDWSATPECSSDAEVLDQVARILSGSPATHRMIAARVQVHRTARGAWSVFLVVDSDAGSRQRAFDAESCEAAAASVAFIMAIAVDPAVAMSTTAPPSPASAPLPASPPASASDSLPAPSAAPAAVVAPGAAAQAEGGGASPASPPARPTAPFTPTEHSKAPRADSVTLAPSNSSHRSFPGVIVLAAAGVDAGTFPQARPGVAIGIGLQPGRWRFEVVGAYWTAQSVTPRGSAAGGEFRAFSAQARAAYGWSFGPFSAGPLAGAGVESIAASGFGGTLANYARTVALGTVGAGGFASWCGRRGVGLRLEVEGEVPLPQMSFSVIEPPPRPNTLVYRMAPVVTRALLGVDIRF